MTGIVLNGLGSNLLAGLTSLEKSIHLASLFYFFIEDNKGLTDRASKLILLFLSTPGILLGLVDFYFPFFSRYNGQTICDS